MTLIFHCIEYKISKELSYIVSGPVVSHIHSHVPGQCLRAEIYIYIYIYIGG